MVLFASDRVDERFSSNFHSMVVHPDDPVLDSRIAFHTDLSFFIIPGKAVFTPATKAAFIEKTEIFASYDIYYGGSPSSPYPNDVRYNAFLVGKYLFCNVLHTEEKILHYADEHGINVVNVKQGYAKCSSIPVSDSAFITSDAGIAKIGKKYGFDVLSVGNEHILLDGFDNGFIGGASACFEDMIFFTGDLSSSPYCDEILSFIDKYGKKAVSVNGAPLYDYGSPIILPDR